MGLDGFFLNSNNGKKIKLEDLQNLKPEDIAKNPELQKILNIFDSDKSGNLEVNERKSLFESLSKASGEDEILSNDELGLWLKKDKKLKNTDVNVFSAFINAIIKPAEIKPIAETTTQESITANLNLPNDIFADDETAQTYFINDFAEYCAKAQQIYDNLNMGAISSALDGIANLDKEKLSSQRLKDSIDASWESLYFMNRAKKGNLTKYEYYKESREHLKKVVMNHVKLHRELIESILANYNAGIDISNGGYKVSLDYSKAEQIIDNYFEELVNNLTIEQIKTTTWKILSLTDEEEAEFFENHMQRLLENAKVSYHVESLIKPFLSTPIGLEERLLESEKHELMSFEEVYQYEQGVPYSREKLSDYVVAKSEVQTVVNCHNRVELFRQAVTDISAELDSAKKLDDFVGFLNNYYAISPDSGINDLEKIIQDNGINAEVRLNDDNSISLEIKDVEILLPYQNKNQSMTQDCFTSNFDVSNLSNEEMLKNIDIDKIMTVMLKLQEERLNSMMKCNSPNGDLNEYLQIYNCLKDEVIGNGGVIDENLVKFAQDTSNDCNARFEEIKCYASMATFVGVGMSIFPLTAGAGGALAIAGMVAENALNLTEAHTRDVTSDEEITHAWKMAGVSAAGMAIGGFAGKVADKAFVKLLGSDLSKTLTLQLTSGSTKTALRTIAKPENLQKFILATGVKMSTDFSISLTGDLILSGVLDTGEDWKMLLKSNLIGIAMGTASDVGQIGKMVHTGRTALPKVDVEADSNQVRINDNGTVLRIDDESNEPPVSATNEISTPSQTSKQSVPITTDGVNTKISDIDGENALKTGLENPLINSSVESDVILDEIKAIFNGSDNITLKELTPEEIEDLKIKIMQKAPIRLNNVNFNNYNIMIACKIILNKDLYECENLIKNFNEILQKTNSPEAVELLELVFSNKKLYKNTDVMKQLAIFVDWTNHPAAQPILSKVFSDDKLCSCDYLINNLIGCLSSINFHPELSKVFDQVLLNEKLYTNENIISTISLLRDRRLTPEHMQLLLKVISDEKLHTNEKVIKHFRDVMIASNPEVVIYFDKIISNENLVSCENVMKNLGSILSSFDYLKAEELLDEILSNEKFYNNELFMKHFCDLGKFIKNESGIEILYRVVSNENLVSCENVMKNLGHILFRIGSPKDVETLDVILSNEKFYNNELFMKHLSDLSIFMWDEGGIEILYRVVSNENLVSCENVMKNLGSILFNINSSKAVETLDVILSNEKFYKNKNIMDNLGAIIVSRNSDFILNQDVTKLCENIGLQYKKVLEAPTKYVNGKYSSESEMIDVVNRYFEKNAASLMVFSAIFDKEAFNHLLRMRFNDVDDYIVIIKNFEPSDLDLLSMMKNAVNIDGKPFMPTQKVEFIDLLQAYKANSLDLTPIKQMTEAGQIDLGKLHINLFNQIMKNAGLSDAEIASIPKEKLTSWDIKYAHLLSKEIQYSQDIAFSDILRAGTLEPDFMKYIHDTGNVYGQANVRTQAMFTESGLDYEKWIHPSKDAEMKFTVKDRNTERLAQIADQILEDIETLRLGPVKGFIDKQFPHCIKDGKFIIPTEVMGSKAKLNEFTENIIKQLDSVWKRAQGNATNPDPKRAQTARSTLTILDHLNQRIKDVSAISEDKAIKSLDWTIKMWDRVPQKDIFQGNYSTCCIAMGGGNGSAMPHYIMDTAYNMIELVDNNSGRTIGNALCYFVKGENGKLAFIIDNVEIANSVKPSDDVGESLRAMLTDYASKIAEDVTGSKDIPVYLGPDYNDIPYEDLPKHVEEVTFLGDIDCDEIYMDAFGASAEWTDKADFTQKVKLLKLK